MQSVYLLPRKKLDVGRILMMFAFPANFSASLTEKKSELTANTSILKCSKSSLMAVYI